MLDNPVLSSLTERHRDLAVTFGQTLMYYHPEYCPFGGISGHEVETSEIAAYAGICEDFFIITRKPWPGNPELVKKTLVCNQMVLKESIKLDFVENIVLLGESFRKELSDLVNLVQPGYFKSKTPELGDYFGIFKNGKLVAVAGERMKMEQFTEVSAVVTHPEYTRNGYARQLVAYVAQKIVQEGKTPYLHVAETNTNAIRLYEQLGFETRCKMNFFKCQP